MDASGRGLECHHEVYEAVGRTLRECGDKIDRELHSKWSFSYDTLYRIGYLVVAVGVLAGLRETNLA